MPAARGDEWDVWTANTTKARKNDDVSARRLENACWRVWNMERRQSERNAMSGGSPSPCAEGGRSFSGALLGSDDDNGASVEEVAFSVRIQDAIGGGIDFTNCRFPAKQDNLRYDDLPTFPIRPNFATFRNSLRPASECVVFDGCPEDPYHPSSMPIYQTSTFVQPSCSEFGAYDYTRSGNPTRTALEKQVALLEKAAAAFAFASGMAALHTVMRLLRAGDEVLVNEDIYGGMHRLLTQDCVHSGVKVAFVDTTDLDAVRKAITPQTRLIHTESPSNPRMRISDLKGLADLAHAHGVLLCVDSTMMPPVICKPLTVGADIVVHSATKFFSGHADCTGGLVCVREPSLAHRVAFLQNAEGTALAPFECFLFLRGIKTMHLRVSRAQENAEQVCSFLRAHPRVKDMFYPGRGGCDAKSLAVHMSQAHGQGCVLSFTTGSVDFSKRFCDACRIFKTTVSFGSVNSLCEMPFTMSHASIPPEQRTLPEDLIRLSVGIEDSRDLVSDLAHALRVAAGSAPSSADASQAYDSRFNDLPVVPALVVGVSPVFETRPAASASPSQALPHSPPSTLMLPEAELAAETPVLESVTETPAPGDEAQPLVASTLTLLSSALLGAGLALLLSRRMSRQA
mmetsp:Transcript_106691/g.308690  ORF Transcript_106691/g.308690 Transcript_106691/m.308690 type:complete len:626 (+) Transcript_106691:133-2010(+)